MDDEEGGMNEQTQRRVIALFDEGKLPQQIADDLDISMQSVIEALKRRLRLIDDEVEVIARREGQKESSMDVLKGRLRVVDEETAPPDREPPRVAASADAFLSVASPLEEVEAPAAGLPPVMTPEAERGLREICCANLPSLEPGLTAVQGGAQLTTSFGAPDFVAKDRHGGAVLVEFTAEEASADAVTRLLGLMAAAQERGGRPVRGILIARDFPEMVRYAARAVPNLALKSYRVSVDFEDA